MTVHFQGTKASLLPALLPLPVLVCDLGWAEELVVRSSSAPLDRRFEVMLVLTSKNWSRPIMAGCATTKLSSKGQVVISEEVRNDLGLSEGDQFVVIGQGDAVIFKVITPPKLEEFQGLLRQARAEAKKAGVKKADLKSAIARVRRRSK
jgi:AbrB family looped-hinge helix DNA binding protein